MTTKVQFENFEISQSFVFFANTKPLTLFFLSFTEPLIA